jgi:YNFM family putative membrane transporter
MTQAGLVFRCFVPSLATTPAAGPLGARLGSARTAAIALLCAAAGASLSLVADVRAIVPGLVLFSSGIFLAQAVATSFVGRAARFERASASGLYLSTYYTGGIAAAAVIGVLYERFGVLYESFGWSAAVIGVLLCLSMALALTRHLTDEPER